MNSLHIETILKFHRTPPGYDDVVECEQKLLTIIDATQPIEVELREMETFRRTLMALAEEALAQMSAPRQMAPFLSVQLRSGEDFDDLVRDHGMTLGREPGQESWWFLHLHEQHKTHYQLEFDSMSTAVRHMKSVLTEWTSAWVSELDFQDSRVDP